MTGGQDISPATSAIRQSVLPTALTQGVSNVAGLYGNFAQNFTSQAAANAANATTLNAAGYTFGTQGAKYATQAAAEEAFKQAGGQGLKTAGMSALGNVVAGAGALYGGFQLGSGLYNMSHDYRKGSDMMDASTKLTQSAEGINYNAYGGFSAQNEIDYVEA